MTLTHGLIQLCSLKFTHISSVLSVTYLAEPGSPGDCVLLQQKALDHADIFSSKDSFEENKDKWGTQPLILQNVSPSLYFPLVVSPSGAEIQKKVWDSPILFLENHLNQLFHSCSADFKYFTALVSLQTVPLNHNKLSHTVSFHLWKL